MRFKPIHSLGILVVLIVLLCMFRGQYEGFTGPQTKILDEDNKSDKKVIIFLKLDKLGNIEKNTITTRDTNIINPTSTDKKITITMIDPTYSIIDYTIRGYNEVTNPKNNPNKCLNLNPDPKDKKAYGWCLGVFDKDGVELLDRSGKKIQRNSDAKGQSSPYTINSLTVNSVGGLALHPTGNNDTDTNTDKAPNNNVNVRIDLALKKK